MRIRILNKNTENVIPKMITHFANKKWAGWTRAIQELWDVQTENHNQLRGIALLFGSPSGKDPVTTVREEIEKRDKEIADLKKKLSDANTAAANYAQNSVIAQNDAKTRLDQAFRISAKYLELAALYKEQTKQLAEALSLGREAAKAGNTLIDQRNRARAQCEELQSKLDAVKYNYKVLDQMNTDLLEQNGKLAVDKILLMKDLKNYREVNIQLTDTIVDLLEAPLVCEVTATIVVRETTTLRYPIQDYIT